MPVIAYSCPNCGAVRVNSDRTVRNDKFTVTVYFYECGSKLHLKNWGGNYSSEWEWVCDSKKQKALK